MQGVEIVTNNPLTVDSVSGMEVVFLEDLDYIDVLVHVRDKVQANYKLLTHPLASNFLPDLTIYKTIIIQQGDELDLMSVSLIEDAIVLAKKALANRQKKLVEPHILSDLQVVDYGVVKYPINKIKNER